jgi:cytochrome c peroxidase
VPERAFTDGRARAALLDAHAPLQRARNTPTLINAALQPTLFDDNRVFTLEDQATDVLGSKNEMGGSLKTATAAVRLKDDYKDDFATAFGVARDSAITQQRLRLALAAYVRSLRATNSRFDRATRGDLAALTAEERDGFTVFMGKAKCGTCHFAPLFNGATPPWLTEAEPEVIGVPLRAVKQGAVIDPDSGRFNVRRIDQHLHAFRTPTLRNIELTAPYMHNGVFKTLDEVLDFYEGGGGHGIGISLAHQTLPVDSLHLTRVEKKAVIAFLRTLTDTVTASGSRE